MLIIPAIDLQDGCVVRFVQGRRDKKVYSRDPLKTAKHWARQGAKLIHVVDLDGAALGVPKNLAIVKEIVRTLDVPVEFGGGVRTIAAIKQLLNIGISRVVLATKAIEDKKFLEKAFRNFGHRVILSIDTQAGSLMIKGWQRAHKGIAVLDFIRLLKKTGFTEIIYTDVNKDGTLKGPNIKEIKSLLKESGVRLIASGGISSLDDLAKLKKIEKQGVTGVIIGKALYEGRFTLKEASKFS